MRVSSSSTPSRVTSRVAQSMAQVGEREPVVLRPGVGSPQQRPEPGEQLLERERLDQVVVGAGIEPVDPVVGGVACGEQQHRDVVPLGADAAAHLEPVDDRHHHVEHHDVGQALGEDAEGPTTVGSGGDVVALEGQAALEAVPDIGFVVDDQDGGHLSTLDRQPER